MYKYHQEFLWYFSIVCIHVAQPVIEHWLVYFFPLVHHIPNQRCAVTSNPFVMHWSYVLFTETRLKGLLHVYIHSRRWCQTFCTISMCLHHLILYVLNICARRQHCDLLSCEIPLFVKKHATVIYKQKKKRRQKRLTTQIP